MRTKFECPVCRQGSWEDVATHHFKKSDLEEGRLKEYTALRYRVLFEVWFPQRAHVEVRSVLCKTCGFISHAPRPDVGDVDAKYRFLQIHEKSIGGQRGGEKEKCLDRMRAERVFKEVAPWRQKESKRVLDFGGGNGKLLASFCARGFDCFLIDYNVQPLPGIIKLGDTINDLKSGESFDIIICSHVLEHLANPSDIVEKLASLLRNGGVLYAEVPMEILGGIKISEPVTHINFFNLCNFKILFQRNGLELLSSRQFVSTYGLSKIEVLGVVARKSATTISIDPLEGVRHTRQLLHTSLFFKLCRRMWLRQFPTVEGMKRYLGRLGQRLVSRT